MTRPCGPVLGTGFGPGHPVPNDVGETGGTVFGATDGRGRLAQCRGVPRTIRTAIKRFCCDGVIAAEGHFTSWSNASALSLAGQGPSPSWPSARRPAANTAFHQRRCGVPAMAVLPALGASIDLPAMHGSIPVQAARESHRMRMPRVNVCPSARRRSAGGSACSCLSRVVAGSCGRHRTSSRVCTRSATTPRFGVLTSLRMPKMATRFPCPGVRRLSVDCQAGHGCPALPMQTFADISGLVMACCRAEPGHATRQQVQGRFGRLLGGIA